MGLGLYASKKLAEVNRGRLTIEKTEPGVGSSFSLDLPLANRKTLTEQVVEVGYRHSETPVTWLTPVAAVRGLARKRKRNLFRS